MLTLTKPQCDRIVCALLLVVTIFRLWYSGHHELVPDESYYWQWSRHLAPGYYDNTPLLAYVIHFFTSLFGTSELTVRLGSVVSAVVASTFLYLLASRLISPFCGLVAVLVANIIPLFAGGAVLMTQDPVQLALWSATSYVIWLAIEPDHTRDDLAGLGLWVLGGALAGLTTLAKLNGILILPAVLLYILLRPEARHWLRKPAPYLASAIAIAMLIPFFHWNATHDHAFALHAHAMSTREYDHNNWPGRALIEYLGAQLALLSPGFFVIYLVTIVVYRPGMPGVNNRRLYAWCLTVVPLAVVALVALHNRVEANWSVAGYIGAAILISDWIVVRLTKGKSTWPIVASFGLAAILSGAVIFFPDQARKALPKVNELYGWQDMANRITEEQRAIGPSFVCGNNYRMPSEAAFYLPGRPTTYCLSLKSRANEYMFWNDPDRLIGQNAILIDDVSDTKPGETDDTLRSARGVFARVEKQPSLKVMQGSSQKPLRVIQVYRCYGFKGYDAGKWQDGW